MATTFGLTPKQRRQRGTATQEQELRADPYHSRQRGASAGLLADIPGSIPDLLNIGADYFYSGLNSLLDVGDLSPYDIPRSLGIHPSQRQPIGPTSEQLEQSLTGAGLLSPTTGTPEETVSRVATGFAEGAPVAALGAITRQSPAFFSGLLSAAQKLPAKGTTQQMTKGLLKGGAKEAEIKEIGLDDWMGQDSPIDDDPTAYRDNIVGFIEDNQLKLHETEKRGVNTQFGEYTEDGGENYTELVLQIDSRSQTAQARRKFENFIDKLTSKSDQPSFSALDFELEVLRRRTLALHSRRTVLRPYIKTDEISESEFEIGTNLLDDIDAAKIRDRRVNARNLPDLPVSETHVDTETGSSWDNQIAHVRFNERIGADGDDILFLEELQSDWSNAGLKHGFETTKQGLVDRVIKEAVEGGLTRDQATAAVNAQLADPSDVLRVYDDNGDRLDTLDEALVKLSKYDDQRLPLNTLFHDLHGKPMDTLARPPGSVPDAPFVKNPNQWARLALGRMLRYAADKGFDKLAWTTGETQAKRWSELKEIRAIGYTPSYELDIIDDKLIDVEKYHVVGYDAEGITKLVDRMSAEQVEKTFGAETLDRFRTEPLDGDSGMIEVDLKIGGEKKKRLYDQVYPNVMKKLVKKMGGVVKRETIGEPNRFDGAKVVEVHDASHSPKYAIEMPDGTLASRNDVFKRAARLRSDAPYIIENRAAQQNNLDELLKVRPLEAWTVTIPRGWKKKIKEGLPLFSALPAAGLLGAQASEDQ